MFCIYMRCLREDTRLELLYLDLVLVLLQDELRLVRGRARGRARGRGRARVRVLQDELSLLLLEVG